MKRGEFEPLNDLEIVRELRLFLASLEGVHSIVVSDHILNLLPEVEGRLPEDQEKMLAVVDRFLALGTEDQMTYVVGRRFGLFEGLADLEDPAQSLAARQTLERLRDRGPDLHAAIREIVSQFI